MPPIESMKVGDPAEGDDVEMGPVISQEQQERVLGFLERLPAKAEVVTGGDANGDRGFFVKPTIVAEVTQDDEIVQREVFGPVVSVQRFATDDEAIAMGERRPLRARRLGLQPRHRPGAERRAQARVRHGLDQRTTSRWPRRCRTAASRSRGTARTSRATRSRSTPESSTSR